MNETLPLSPESQHSINVLEIGCGIKYETATFEQGELLRQPQAHYVGIDLPMLFWPKEGTFYSNINQGDNPVPSSEGQYIAANATSLPFPDDSYDLVLMRSVFGELSMEEEFQSTNAASLRKSLTETLRVLRVGGEFVIAEENTPFDSDKLSEWLSDAGFEIEKLVFMNSEYSNSSENTDWEAIRVQYYGGQPTSTKPGNYILVAKKP